MTVSGVFGTFCSSCSHGCPLASQFTGKSANLGSNGHPCPQSGKIMKLDATTGHLCPQQRNRLATRVSSFSHRRS